MRHLGSKSTLTALLCLLLAGSAAAESASNASAGAGRRPPRSSPRQALLQDLGRIAPDLPVRQRLCGGRRGRAPQPRRRRHLDQRRIHADEARLRLLGGDNQRAANGRRREHLHQAWRGERTVHQHRRTPIGSGPSPCWRGDRVTVFRGAIPLSLASGNGLYLVLLRPGANGSRAGESPWEASDPPLFEGVSIVLVGSGNSTVTVYDRGFAGEMFFDDLTYRLNSPVSVANAREVILHNIGADGQTGVGVKDLAARRARSPRSTDVASPARAHQQEAVTGTAMSRLRFRSCGTPPRMR